MASVNLDTGNSIRDHNSTIDISKPIDAIPKIIQVISRIQPDFSIVCSDMGEHFQHTITVTYLKKPIPLTFEFDVFAQFINVVWYKTNLEAVFLKILIPCNHHPSISYVHNDHSGEVPEYHDDAINLKPGEYLMNLAHALLKWTGFSTVELQDETTYISMGKTGEIRSRLWLYQLVKKGSSWYSKFGYQRVDTHSKLNVTLSAFRSTSLDSIQKYLHQQLQDHHNQFFTETANTILELITDLTETIGSYLYTHSFKEFNKLINALSQSTFKDMEWYHQINQLYKLNYQQINTSISCYRIESLGDQQLKPISFYQTLINNTITDILNDTSNRPLDQLIDEAVDRIFSTSDY